MSIPQPDRRPYLRAIPPSDRVRARLQQLLLEIGQLRLLLKLAEDLEHSVTADLGAKDG